MRARPHGGYDKFHEAIAFVQHGEGHRSVKSQFLAQLRQLVGRAPPFQGNVQELGGRSQLVTLSPFLRDRLARAYRPVFTKQPESWQEWWSAVRSFTAAWYGIPAGEVRGRDPRIEAVEREAGFTISASVHEWAAFAADLGQAGIFDCAMRDQLTLGWDADSNALRLLTIVEGDVDWVVL